MKRYLPTLLARAGKKLCLIALAVAMTLSCRAVPKGMPIAESFSETKWIYAPPAADPPSNAYLRLAFDVTKPVETAYVYACREKSKGAWLDGKPIEFKGRRPEFAKVRGSWQAATLDLKPLLAPGRHVLTFQLSRLPEKCYGMILRGEIVFSDGERRELLSSARSFKASGTEEQGWLEPGFDDSAWKSAIELGDPCLLPWSRQGDTMRMYASLQEYARYQEFLKTGDLPPEQERRLLGEPPQPTVRIVYSGDTPGIEINGKVLPPYVHAHMDMEAIPARERYFCHLRDLGMNIFGVKDFRRNRFEPEEGHYDFSPLDASLRRMLALNPDSYFILSYGNGKRLPKGWAERNPDELVGYAVPCKSMEECSYITNAKVPSIASQVYRESERRFWMAFGEYAKSQPWGRRIIGVHCGFGGSGDGMPTGAHCMPDTGKRMTEAFRRYLSEKYATDGDLQRAWGDEAVTLATAAVPDSKLRSGSGAYIRNLSDPRDRRLADYYDCYHKTFEEFILDFGATVKAALPGRIVGAYHGYSVLAYTPEGNTARIGRLLRSKDIDYFFATTRGYNLTDGLHRNLPSLCRMYGKLTSIEGDVRTYVSSPKEASDKWRCKTPAETRATFAKIVSNALVSGSGWHMVDFGVYAPRKSSPWFDIPEALEPFAVALREWRRAWERPVRSSNEVAVVLDLEQLWKQGPAHWNVAQVMSNNLQVYPLQALNFSGFPYDLLAPEGYLASKDRYKAVVFLNLYETTPVLRGKLRAKLAADGSTALWCYAPGLAEPGEGFSTRAMRELTGMELDFASGPRTYVMKEASGGSDALYGVIPGFKYVPRVFAKDAACEVSATWKDDCTAAIAKKRIADGTMSVFVGLPPHRSAKWAGLLADAGCKAVTKPGFMVRRGNGYTEVFSGKGSSIPPESKIQEGQIDQSGSVEVRPLLPAAKLTDLFTGETYEVRDGRATLTADSPRTWLFREVDAVGEVAADKVVGIYGPKIAARYKIVKQDKMIGFTRTIFEMDGCEAWVVEPAKPAADGRWIWCMEWPAAFQIRTGVQALLAAGYRWVTFNPASKTIYAGNQNDEMIAKRRAFQKFLVDELGFAPKCGLVGMSWGGFYSVRYASTHPDCVCAAYLDAPLLDFSSLYNFNLPTGNWNRKGLSKYYPFITDTYDGADDPYQSVNRAVPIAKAGIPVLILYGAKDVTVPPEKNCIKFAAAFEKAGGDLVIERRSRYGHHPHGVEPGDVQRIVNFFDRAYASSNEVKK